MAKVESRLTAEKSGLTSSWYQIFQVLVIVLEALWGVRPCDETPSWPGREAESKLKVLKRDFRVLLWCWVWFGSCLKSRIGGTWGGTWLKLKVGLQSKIGGAWLKLKVGSKSRIGVTWGGTWLKLKVGLKSTIGGAWWKLAKCQQSVVLGAVHN